MPFLRPSLTALQQQALIDYTSGGFSGQLLEKSILRVIANAQAGLAFLHYGYMDWIAKQSVPFTADGEALEGWAALKNVVRESATVSIGNILVTGVNSSILPAGSLLQTTSSIQYSVDFDVVISGTTGVGTITAVNPGLDGNANTGIPLTTVSTFSGITSIITTSALTGGADMEDTNSLRTRMLQIYQAPPQGGSQTDYIEWARATPGVTRAWCLPGGAGLGSVVIYVMFDVTEAVHNGFPVGSNGGAFAESRITVATGDQLAVANYLYPLRPVTALVYVAAPTPYTIDVTIANLNPGGSVIIAGIAAALSATFVRIGDPLGMTVYQSEITNSISSVSGVVNFVVISPSTTVSIPVGSLPVLGTVTYI